MPNYNFKKEVEVYVVSGTNRYQIDVSDVSFSQTFAEESYNQKTLHFPTDFFEGSVVNRANPANFTFAVAAIEENDFSIIETLLLEVSTFDLFVKTPTDIFKVAGCVITNGTFVIEKSQPLSIEVQGEGSRLTRGASLTGTAQSRNATKTYNIPRKLICNINGTAVPYVVSVTVDLQNEITWNPYKTVNGALTATTASTSQYPSSFTIGKKILSGSILAYLTNINASEAQTWSTNASIQIQAGNGLSAPSFRGFNFGPATCSFTNRVGTGDIFLHSYDWRMTQNPNNLANELQYITD